MKSTVTDRNITKSEDRLYKSIHKSYVRCRVNLVKNLRKDVECQHRVPEEGPPLREQDPLPGGDHRVLQQPAPAHDD